MTPKCNINQQYGTTDTDMVIERDMVMDLEMVMNMELPIVNKLRRIYGPTIEQKTENIKQNRKQKHIGAAVLLKLKASIKRSPSVSVL